MKSKNFWAPRVTIESHPDVIPFSALRKDGTIAPAEELGMTITIHRPPYEMPENPYPIPKRRRR